ncbi:hypothetical protein CMUS01_03649 [Colletotrichum musicola]|uniref:Uncharacterized protein n=1 Tax=Colletotrichum musicola TaxID=2175873 RepID=A0A8H6U5U7_9PEZI|nr:hypothetical protein CMUS01_03649 [Colletotrichum musicola]
MSWKQRSSHFLPLPKQNPINVAPRPTRPQSPVACLFLHPKHRRRISRLRPDFYAVASIVSFNLLPLSLVEHLLHAVVNVPAEFFLFPGADVLVLGSGSWTLHQMVLLVTTRAITARLALAFAGWIVRKRLPAHSFCAGAGGSSPSIRWWFEYFCYFANRHRFVAMDLERYIFKTLELLGVASEAEYSLFVARGGSPLTQLGTVCPRSMNSCALSSTSFKRLMGSSPAGTAGEGSSAARRWNLTSSRATMIP